jgi:plasmid stabilization system protein ParE
MRTKPNISSNFTIEDIHKIREWHYELRKEMGVEKYAKQLNKKVKNILADFPNAKIIAL